MKFKNEIKKYIKDYKFNSLFFKNLMLLFLLIIVPISGTVILAYYSYSNLQKNEIRSYNESLIADMMADMENIIKAAETQLIYIGFNSNVELYMYDTEEITQLNYKVTNISELLKLPVVSKDYISSIYVNSHRSKKVITVEGISDYNTFGDREIFEQYNNEKTGNKQLFLTTNQQTYYPKKQLSIFQDIKYGSASTGVAVMNLKPVELAEELNIEKNSNLLISDGKQVLLSGNLDMVGKPVNELPYFQNLIMNNTVITKEYCLSSKVSTEYGFEVLSYFDLHEYQDRLSTIRTVILTFIIIMAAITVGLGAFISIRLFTPIGTILSSIDEYRTTLIDHNYVFKEKDELMYILNTIKRTADNKKNVEKELSERVRLLKKAQSVALQSQINPHFMNNTLETINWMAIGLLGGKNEISEMTGALSKMLRMALENTDTIIPLMAEIEHCESYIEIQKKRYENKFDVLWEIPEGLCGCKTIRIILQPIIENAIYHGIKHLSNKGIIIVSAGHTGNIIELKVKDNGLGLTLDEVTELNRTIQSDMIKESKHIGITNVNQRIKLYFGEDYGVSIESTEGSGTCVSIKLPYIKD